MGSILKWIVSGNIAFLLFFSVSLIDVRILSGFTARSRCKLRTNNVRLSGSGCVITDVGRVIASDRTDHSTYRVGDRKPVSAGRLWARTLFDSCQPTSTESHIRNMASSAAGVSVTYDIGSYRACTLHKQTPFKNPCYCNRHCTR